MDEAIKRHLQMNNCEFEIIQHDEPILTLEDASKYFDISKAVAVLILKSESNFYGYLKYGTRKVDLKQLSQALCCERLKLASANEVQEVTGYKIGYVPLVGLDVPYVMDKQMAEWDYFYGGIGTDTESIKMNVSDFIKLYHEHLYMI